MLFDRLRLLGVLCVLVSTTNAATLSVEEVVSHCQAKPQGRDQRSTLKITMTSRDGNESTSEYVRLWKDYSSVDDLVEKMALFTTSPKESVGLNYLRWAYQPSSDKAPEQWVHLPE
ncbi:MAG: hypothetical protein FD130_1570, partial [Halothiobacillaceae bacterium]